MAYRSSSTLASASSTGAVVPVPTGAAIGDIAVVGIYVENTDTITPPAGFTAKVDLATSPTLQGRLVVYWKRLTAADTGNYSFTWTNLAFRSGECALFSGRVGSGDPFDGTPGTAESTGTVTTLNVSTSPAFGQGDAVGFWTNFQGGATWTAPGSYTQRQSEVVLAAETRDAVAAGSTGNVTPTASISDFMKAFLGVLIPAPIVTHAQSLADSTGGSLTTAAFTPVAGDLLVVFASASDSVDTAPTLTNSAGLTFALITRVDCSDVVPTSLYLFVANQLATAVSQTVTFDTPGDANTGSFIFVARAAGMARTGSSAVRQFAQQAINSGIAPAPVFAVAALTANLCLGAVTNGLNPATMTPPTGWTEAVDLGYSTPTTGSEYAFINGGFTGTTVTWGSTSASLFGAIAVELDTSTGVVVAAAAATVMSHATPGRTWRRRFRHRQYLSAGTVSGPFSFNQSLNGTLSFTSSETLRTSKGLAGTLSFTGAVTKRLATTLAAATVSFTSSQTRAIKTNLAATLSFTSSQTRRVIKGLSATLSFTGSVTKRTTTALVGATLSFTSSQTRRTSKGLSATVSFTGSLATATVHLFTQALNATLSFTSSQTRSIGTHLAATVSFTSSQTRSIGKVISAAVSFTGSQTRAIRTNLAGTLSFTSSQTRRVVKGLGTATLSFTGSVTTAAVHTFTQALNATLSFTGSQTRSVSKGLSATVSFTGSLARRTGKGLSATVSFTSSQTRAIKTNLAGTLSFTSAQTRRTVKSLGTATLSFTGSVTTAAVHFFNQALNATLSFTGSQTRRTSKTVAATVSFTSSQTRRIFTGLAGTLSFTSSQTRLVKTNLAGVISFTSSQTRRVVKALAATLSFTGSLLPQRIILKALSASLSFTGSQTRRTFTTLAAGLSFTGSQTKRIAKTISAAIGLTGLVNLLATLVATKGTASAAQMSVADSTPGSTTTPGSSAASGVVPEAIRGSGTVPTSDAGNAPGPTSSAP